MNRAATYPPHRLNRRTRRKRIHTRTKVRTEMVVDVCPRSSGHDVVYTTQMAAIPAFRNAYRQYQQTKDKAAYYDVIQQEIQKRVGRPGLSMQQSMVVLRSLGISQCEDLRIRLSHATKSDVEWNLTYDVLVPLIGGAALGGLLLTKNCPCLKKADLMYQSLMFGGVVLLMHGAAKYLEEKYPM